MTRSTRPPKRRMGRPPLPPEERAQKRISLRLYPEDAALLERLCEELAADESEVLRLALRVFAARRVARKKKRATE